MSEEQHKMIAEDVLFSEWIAARPGVDFVRDGVVDEEAFKANPLKIVFVLKDTDGGDFDLREFLFEGAWNGSGFRDGGHTYGPVRRVLAKIKKHYGLPLWTNKRKSFRDLAVINIKKKAGAKSCPPQLLAEAAKEGADFIARQFSLYDGTGAIFICCRTAAFLRQALEGRVEVKKVEKDGIRFYSFLTNCAFFESDHHPMGARIAKWDAKILATVVAIKECFKTAS